MYTTILITNVFAYCDVVKPSEVTPEVPPQIEPTVVAESPPKDPEPPPAQEQNSINNETHSDPSPYFIAKTVWGEARGCSKLQQAAVIWCILNRVDHESMPNNIIAVVTQPGQFDGYNPNNPVTDDIYELTIDVIHRWNREKNGETDVGRVLPKDYIYFRGDGVNNIFRNAYTGGDIWNWRLGDPYATS